MLERVECQPGDYNVHINPSHGFVCIYMGTSNIHTLSGEQLCDNNQHLTGTLQYFLLFKAHVNVKDQECDNTMLTSFLPQHSKQIHTLQKSNKVTVTRIQYQRGYPLLSIVPFKVFISWYVQYYILLSLN